MHMFKGGFTPWKANPEWARQARAERLAEEARQKKREESGGGDVVVKIIFALAGAGLVGTLFSGPGVPIQ